jgi:hypothetical protein
MANVSLIDYFQVVSQAEHLLDGRMFFVCPLKSFHSNGVWTLRTREGDVICEISDDGIVNISEDVLKKPTPARGHASQVKQVLKDRWEFFGPKGFYAYVEAVTSIEAARKGWLAYLQSPASKIIAI